MAGGTLTPLTPLTMQELKLSQTLDGANMSPYHTSGEFASLIVLETSNHELRNCSFHCQLKLIYLQTLIFHVTDTYFFLQN